MPPIGRLCLICTARKSLRSRWVARPVARPVDLRDTYFHGRRSESGWSCDLAQTGAGHPPRPRVRAARGGRQSPAKRRRESGRRGCSTAGDRKLLAPPSQRLSYSRVPAQRIGATAATATLPKPTQGLACALDLRHHRRWVCEDRIASFTTGLHRRRPRPGGSGYGSGPGLSRKGGSRCSDPERRIVST